MNKEHFKQEMRKIKIPHNEVITAIHNGVEKGKQEQGIVKRSKAKSIGIVTSIAASIVLVSGLLFAPVSNAFASVPVLGSFYEKFGLQIGNELLESDLITQLHQEATSSGINITITSAYYDGNIIGVTFKADGEKISLNKIGEAGPETGYNVHLFNGDEEKQWSASKTALEKTKDGYIAAMEFDIPDADLPKDYTLPLTFTSITGVKGIWKFDVPVKQIPLKTITAKGKSVYQENTDYTVQMESINEGKATTLLNYKTTFPLVGKNDEIDISVFDNEGNRLSKNHTDVLSTEDKNDIVVKDVREVFNSKINETVKYLIIQPEISRYEQDTLASLDKQLPFVVNSSRFDYKIKVNDMKQTGNQIILDYHIENIDTKDFEQDIIHNFADFITLIESDHIPKAKGELNGEQTINYLIDSKETKEMSNGDLHFRSVFTIENTDHVNMKDYSIVVPFDILSSNQPIKMEPIKIELDT